MVRFCCSVLLGALSLVGLSLASARGAMFTQTVAGNSYTIVEPDAFLTGGAAGNTVNMNSTGQFWAQNTGGNQASRWLWRDFASLHFNAPAGTVAGDRDLFELGTQSPTGPNLRTTFSVAPDSYNVYLVQMVSTAAGATAGLNAALLADIDTGQAAPTTLRNKLQPGLISSGILGGANFEVVLNPLGTVTGASISVLVGAISNPYPTGWRGDYVGIAYAPVPEPGTLILAIAGIGLTVGGYAGRKQFRPAFIIHSTM